MTETTGTDRIRDALRVRNRKINLTPIARELGVNNATLEAFITGSAKLSPDLLKALTKELFPMSEFVPELDVLRPALQEPARLLGVPPQLSIPLPRYAPGPGQGPRPVTDAAAKQPRLDRRLALRGPPTGQSRRFEAVGAWSGSALDRI